MEIRYRGGTISPEEVVRFLVLTGQAEPILAEIVRRKEVVKKAGELGLSVADEELQEVADGYRRIRGLYSAKEMERFLDENGITEEDFEAFCEASALLAKVRAHLATPKRIEEHFVEHRSELDRARISAIQVKEKALAEEIRIQATEEGEDFHALARKYSLDEATRYAGGHVGVVTRRMLPPEVAAKVFNAMQGDILGPFEREGCFKLLLVDELRRAELNEEVREAIVDRIFQDWCSPFWKDGIRVVR